MIIKEKGIGEREWRKDKKSRSEIVKVKFLAF
jgi:hypothetical protein